jgi:hypothetical protein
VKDAPSPEIRKVIAGMTLKELASRVEKLGYLVVAWELQRRLDAGRDIDEPMA